jgi:Cys-Gly metallodipeptidase DUG1
VTVSGPTTNLHSGVDGGVINEPMMDLMTILSAIVDSDGKVTIESFYDDVAPVTPEEEVPFFFYLFETKY